MRDKGMKKYKLRLIENKYRKQICFLFLLTKEPELKFTLYNSVSKIKVFIYQKNCLNYNAGTKAG